MRRPIAQKHDMGCGIACTAFVLGCSYEVACKLLHKSSDDAQTTGVFCREIVSALEVKGLYAEFRYIKRRVRKKIYQDGVIVFVVRSKRYPYGHYLCRWQGRWMDPWINGPDSWDLSMAKAGWRKRLPGQAIYAIFVQRG